MIILNTKVEVTKYIYYTLTDWLYEITLRAQTDLIHTFLFLGGYNLLIGRILI